LKLPLKLRADAVMAKRNIKKQNLEQQVLINRKKLKEEIKVCELGEKLGSTDAAKMITANGRQIGRTTVRQIYVTYQVFLASKIIQKLFDSGMISWSDIYKSRNIYNRGRIKEDLLIRFENKLLTVAGTNREELKLLMQSREFSDKETEGEVDRYENFDKYYQALEKEVNQSRIDALSRKERLKTAPKKPKVIEITHRVFERNPDVIVEVLERAKGSCERCEKAAPFVRKSDRIPFLEVHHKIPLAQGGEDTVENAVALCPNCHREMHYGFLS